MCECIYSSTCESSCECEGVGDKLQGAHCTLPTPTPSHPLPGVCRSKSAEIWGYFRSGQTGRDPDPNSSLSITIISFSLNCILAIRYHRLWALNGAESS